MAWNEPGGNGNKPKDPWGNNNKGNGGGGGNQPPDLDEVIRKLTDKLNGLFGGKKSGGNNNNGGDGDGSDVAAERVATAVATVTKAVATGARAVLIL